MFYKQLYPYINCAHAMLVIEKKTITTKILLQQYVIRIFEFGKDNA